MNKEAEVGLIVPRITQYFLAIFEYIPFAVRIPFAVPPPVVGMIVFRTKYLRGRGEV